MNALGGHVRPELEGALPTLRGLLDAELARLETTGQDFGARAAAHPASSWLFRRRAGELSSERLGCATPADVLRLADALGLALTREPFPR